MASTQVSRTSPALKLFTKEQVAQHKSEDSLWIVIDTVVYDVTNFVE